MNYNQINTPEELLKYMRNNISYGYVGKNGKRYYDSKSIEWNDWEKECFVQSGKEVLVSNTGTCWDQVEFERMWFEQKGFNIKTFFIWFEVGRQNNLPTHTFLLYEKNNKWYWFENSFEMYRGIHEYENLDSAVEDIKNKHIQFASHNSDYLEDDKDTLTCYEYSKPAPCLGVDEYIDFVTTNEYKKLG